MKLWKVIVMFVALVTASAVARASSHETHQAAGPTPTDSKTVAPHHDRGDDSGSRENEEEDDDDDENDEDESELSQQMEQIGKNFKKLGRLFREDTPDINEALKLIASCKKGATAAKDLVPSLVEKMEIGKEKDDALKQYQEQISKLAKTFTELELVLKEGDIEKAKGLLDLLKKQKKDGHNQFMEEDEEKS